MPAGKSRFLLVCAVLGITRFFPLEDLWLSEETRGKLRLYDTMVTTRPLQRDGSGAKFVEGSFEVSGDGGGFLGFDVAAGHHVDQFAIAENGD